MPPAQNIYVGKEINCSKHSFHDIIDMGPFSTVRENAIFFSLIFKVERQKAIEIEKW